MDATDDYPVFGPLITIVIFERASWVEGRREVCIVMVEPIAFRELRGTGRKRMLPLLIP
eukprot:COSAG02_NODE_9500_length_2197_cov_2.208294_2_plen_59_part_00